ncbi:unnamed protein product [Xylocopa violacea]|uniref:Uncharacterized protein n=1 Tax=Xylocopa violacea TaxID=135666 RepID=A0ABP1NRC9_XYLVO
MENKFNLLKLINFLHQALVFTQEVRTIIKLDCDEAMYCLKPWSTQASSQEEINQDVCTCLKPEIEIEEIAVGISKTLVQTQQLREKVALNLKGQNMKCLNLYKYFKGTDSKKQKNIRNTNENSENVGSRYDFNVTTKPSMQDTSIAKESQNKIAQKSVHVIQDKKTKNDKKSAIQPRKLTENKNFLAINKKNIKNIRVVKQRADINYKLEHKSSSTATESKSNKLSEKPSTSSTSELKNLIQKVSSKPNVLSSEHSIKCPLHNNIIPQSINKQNSITTTIVDSFNVTDIPEEIIKPLKVYHRYLNIQFSEKLYNEKRHKVFYKFLVELKETDNIVQKLVHKNYIITPLLEFISLYQTIFSENLGLSNLIDVKTIYTELSSTWKMYETKEFNSINVFNNDVWKTSYAPPNTMEYISNGIWNLSCIKNIEEMSKLYCIQYTNRTQLLSFFDVLQQLQCTKYYEDLINIIAQEILPNMKICFNPTQLEYIKIYKMFSILHQGLNPKIPVLVRTDK